MSVLSGSHTFRCMITSIFFQHFSKRVTAFATSSFCFPGQQTLNPLYTGRLFHCYMVDKILLANNVDPDQIWHLIWVCTVCL